MIYDFHDAELDLDRYELRRNAAVVRIEPQVFDLLTLLVRQRLSEVDAFLPGAARA